MQLWPLFWTIVLKYPIYFLWSTIGMIVILLIIIIIVYNKEEQVTEQQEQFLDNNVISIGIDGLYASRKKDIANYIITHTKNFTRISSSSSPSPHTFINELCIAIERKQTLVTLLNLRQNNVYCKTIINNWLRAMDAVMAGMWSETEFNLFRNQSTLKDTIQLFDLLIYSARTPEQTFSLWKIQHPDEQQHINLYTERRMFYLYSYWYWWLYIHFSDSLKIAVLDTRFFEIDHKKISQAMLARVLIYEDIIKKHHITKNNVCKFDYDMCDSFGDINQSHLWSRTVIKEEYIYINYYEELQQKSAVLLYHDKPYYVHRMSFIHTVNRLLSLGKKVIFRMRPSTTSICRKHLFDYFDELQ